MTTIVGRSGEFFRLWDVFAASHRGGTGAPLVLLHGFTDTWRTWEPVLTRLERSHDVLAATLPGHAGGPPLPDPLNDDALLDLLEAMLDAAGIGRTHLAGNSLGGYLALRLAERGRALSVVALAPAGGWAVGDESWRELLDFQRRLRGQAAMAAPFAERILASPAGRRRATELITVAYEHISPDLLAHQLLGVAACAGADALVEHALHSGWCLHPELIDCPVRIVWGAEDRLLPWPAAAARYREQWLPHADWVELRDVGHCPQLDVPAVAAELISSFAR